MKIKWLGHSCFLITLENGKKIITDPYDDSVGYGHISEEADYVLVSHDHYDHNYTEGISGKYTLVNKPGEYHFYDADISGYELSHDDAGGSKRGKVTAFVIKADGNNILHMGDVGEMPDKAFFDSIGRIDVLLIPVGGVYTIDAKEAFDILEILQPNITVPMHYMTTSLKFALKGVHEFEQISSGEYDISRIGHTEITVDAGDRKKRPRIIIMQHAN